MTQNTLGASRAVDGLTERNEVASYPEMPGEDSQRRIPKLLIKFSVGNSNSISITEARYHHCMTIMSDKAMFIGFGRNEVQNMEPTGNKMKIVLRIHQNLCVCTSGWIYYKSQRTWSAPIIFTVGREKPICGTFREPGSGVNKVIVAGGGQAETVEVITADDWRASPRIMSKKYHELFIGSIYPVGEIPR